MRIGDLISAPPRSIGILKEIENGRHLFCYFVRSSGARNCSLNKPDQGHFKINKAVSSFELPKEFLQGDN